MKNEIQMFRICLLNLHGNLSQKNALLRTSNLTIVLCIKLHVQLKQLKNQWDP